MLITLFWTIITYSISLTFVFFFGQNHTIWLFIAIAETISIFICLVFNLVMNYEQAPNVEITQVLLAGFILFCSVNALVSGLQESIFNFRDKVGLTVNRSNFSSKQELSKPGSSINFFQKSKVVPPPQLYIVEHRSSSRGSDMIDVGKAREKRASSSTDSRPMAMV